ncbi:MAG: ester cyclase [Nitrolancea sp.]
MSSEANKNLIRSWMTEVLTGHDIDAIEKYFAPNCVHHDLEMGDSQGVEAEKQLTSNFVTAFPDLAFTLQNVLGEGELVSGIARITGTHNGDLMGVPPTGKPFEASIMAIFRIVDGKIVEHWSHANVMSQLVRLGIMPQPTGASA